VHDLESHPMTRHSFPRWIALAVAMAMLIAGCGSSREAGPTEPTSQVSARTTTPGGQPSRATPARSGSLAYGVDGDIYVADWDGSNPVRIADGHRSDECGHDEYWGEGPIWSPDGRYLAFRHSNCESQEAWGNVVISDPKGNVVAEFPARGWDISWSPDSTRVAVWLNFGKTIGVFAVDGERQARITLPSGWRQAGDHDPVWLEGGESLVLQGMAIPIDGSTPYTLRPARGAPSPDGSRTAYATRKSLVLARADGSSRQTVFDGTAWDAVWSPAGDRIAFMTPTSGPGAVNQLRVLDVATGTVTSVVAPYEFGTTGAKAFLSVLDWSPQGDRILFARQEVTQDDPSDPGALRTVGVGSLWSVNVDGSDAQRLVAGTIWGDWLSTRPGVS
jgi:Tol biopolymer transport system component